MSIYSVYGIMNQLENHSAKTVKEQILKNNKGDTSFREALEFLLNPYIVTGISTKKMKKKVEKSSTITALTELSDVIKYLKNNNSGRDIDIATIQTYIDTLNSEELKTFVAKLVTKNLKLGISAKTVNKVYGKGTIPTFDVMLAESYAKKKDKLTGKFYITLKLDGNRCVAVKEHGKVKFFTRKGQEIEGLIELEKEFELFADGMVYDGELLLENKNKLPSDELFRLTQKVVRKDGEKKDLVFHIFDSLPLSEFKDGKSKKTYEQRRNTINLFDETTHIKILPVLYAGSDKSMIQVMANIVESDGYEGIMVNTASGLYQSKRVVDLLKVKSMNTADLLVIGMEEGTGKNEGKLGAVLVEYKGGTTKVGSGFTDEQRSYFWNNPESIEGKIIETQYFEESIDEKTKQVSLRFPVFKCIREDKSVDDIRYE